MFVFSQCKGGRSQVTRLMQDYLINNPSGQLFGKRFEFEPDVIIHLKINFR